MLFKTLMFISMMLMNAALHHDKQIVQALVDCLLKRS